MADKDDIAEALEAFEEIDGAEAKNRAAWVEDMRFAMLGEQWPEWVAKQRKQEGRPMLTINRQPAFIRQVVNDGRMNKPQIQVHPVGDGADKATASILNGLIRNIEYSSNADIAYDTALEHAVAGGFGYFRINTHYATDDTFDQDLLIERIANPLSVYGDCRSRAADSSDWNVAFITDTHTEDEFKKAWPKAEPIDFDDKTHDDKRMDWLKKGQIRVAEWWTREDVDATIYLIDLAGSQMVVDEERLKSLREVLPDIQIVGSRKTKSTKVRQRIINGQQVLEDNAWAGKYIPIVPVYGSEVIVENERTLKSLVRDTRDAQMMYNFWRTASTELVALAPKAPWVGKKGFANNSPSKWASANTKNHAYLEYDGDEMPQRQPFAGPPAGALQEALNASDDMKAVLGIYDAALGARSNETSGVAISARSRESDTSTFHFIDNENRAIRHAGRILVDMIPHVYTQERIIRVIHEDGANDSVPINSQIPPGQPMPGLPKHMQEMEGLKRIYDLTTGKYDVTCKAGPSFTTRREEAAQQMGDFIRAFPAAGPLLGDLLAKNLDWPGADEIAERLKAMLPPQLQGANPQADMLKQQMQQLDMQAKEAVGQLNQQLGECQAELQKASSEAESAKLQKQADTMKIEIDAYKAVSERMKVGMDLMAGASQALMPMVQQASTEMDGMRSVPGVQPTGAQPQEQQKNDLSEAVASITQLVDKLMQPRAVVRDENGLISQI